NAEAFHQRATKLKGKGAFAIFSGGEIKALMAEVQAAAKASGARYKADKAAGRPIPYCPPKESKMSSDELMARLAAIPVEERRKIDMTEAMTRIMTAKYPCKS